MKKKKRADNGKKEKRLQSRYLFLESFKEIRTAGFWKAFAFDLISLFAFLAILLLFFAGTAQTLDLTGELQPLAKETANMLNMMKTTGSMGDIDKIKSNTDELRSMMKHIVFMFIAWSVVAVAAILIVFGFLNFLAWKLQIGKEISMKSVWKFYLIILSWLITTVALLLLSVWTFKLPFSALFAFIFIFISAYLCVLAKMLFFSGFALKSSLKKCFRAAVCRHSLLWIVAFLFMLLIIALVSGIIMRIGQAGSIITLSLFIMLVPWSRAYLKLIFDKHIQGVCNKNER